MRYKKRERAKLPKISIVMLTYNGESCLEKALQSVKKQDYPKKLIELIILDNGSSDKSVSIAKKYSKIVSIDKRSAYIIRAKAMRKSSGEFTYMILEQDMEFKSKYFLKKMVKPLLEDKTLAASFTREYPKKGQPWVNRFISYDPIQRDPLFEFLSESIENTIIEKRSGYDVCEYTIGNIPPTTHMLFRTKFLKNTSVWRQKQDFDHDTIAILVESGYSRFAYVSSAGDYHHHAKNLNQLVQKRIRNLNNHFFTHYKTTKHQWVRGDKKYIILKLILWVIYANLILPATLRGIIRYFKYRDWVLLTEPLITIVVTDLLLIEFIKNKKGRKIIYDLIKFK